MPPTSRRSAFLRACGFLLAAALGIVGVWLIVTGNDSKTVRVGAISGFWGLLFGTYAMFGTRLPAIRTAPETPPAPPPTRELDLRQVGELERAAVAAARQEFQQELQAMLRREVTEGFAREVADLRSEVTALRSELVEKVGGQLRLERIETTRLIGSDLEALQSELRKLRETNAEGETHDVSAPLPAAISLAPPASAPPLSRPSVPEPPLQQQPSQRAAEPEIHDAEIVEETRHHGHDGTPAARAAPPPPAAHSAPAAQVPGPEQGDDPFAGMPRITPFTEFPLDPIPAVPPEESTGRRHRADDGGNDVLARILAREQR